MEPIFPNNFNECPFSHTCSLPLNQHSCNFPEYKIGARDDGIDLFIVKEISETFRFEKGKINCLSKGYLLKGPKSLSDCNYFDSLVRTISGLQRGGVAADRKLVSELNNLLKKNRILFNLFLNKILPRIRKKRKLIC